MAPIDTERVHVLGIRHHGPGSARAVRAELDDSAPTSILIEGPPEADALLAHVATAMEPPVALLAYDAGRPRPAPRSGRSRSSPRNGRRSATPPRHGVPVRFCDLPAAHTLGLDEPEHADHERVPRPRRPARVLAEAAGYDDAERWWDDVVEQRRDGGPSPFPAIAEAMAAVRAELAPDPETEREARREAHMRKVLRATLRAGYERIAVVCGAWHVPALARPASRHRRHAGSCADCRKPKSPQRGCPGRTAGSPPPPDTAPASAPPAGTTTCSPPPTGPWNGGSPRRRDSCATRTSPSPPPTSSKQCGCARLSQPCAAARCPGSKKSRTPPPQCSAKAPNCAARLVHDAMVVGERLGTVPPTTRRPSPCSATWHSTKNGCVSNPRHSNENSSSTCAKNGTGNAAPSCTG